jgi:hypothetical protein
VTVFSSAFAADSIFSFSEKKPYQIDEAIPNSINDRRKPIFFKIVVKPLNSNFFNLSFSIRVLLNQNELNNKLLNKLFVDFITFM